MSDVSLWRHGEDQWLYTGTCVYTGHRCPATRTYATSGHSPALAETLDSVLIVILANIEDPY